MDSQAVFIYCLCDEIVKSLGLKDDKQCRMSSSEIMTFVVLSSLYYNCDYRKTRLISISLKYFPKILSNSQIVRRIHKIPHHIWLMTFHICKEILLDKNNREFIVDSFPIACCQNNKIFRCRLFQGKEYHGYNASKKSYFFGLKVHMIVNCEGIPMEFVFTPGSEGDSKGFKRFECYLSKGSKIYADKAYTNYFQEDLLLESSGIKLIPKRRKNLKRQNDPYDDFFLSINRNKIETVFSSIVSLMPRSVRAVTAKGFCLKIFFFVFGYMVKRIYAQQ